MATGSRIDLDALLETGDEHAIQKLRASLDAIVHADKRKLFRADGSMVPPTDWPDDIMPAIVRIDPSRGRPGEFSVMFADPIRAAAELAKIDGMYAKTASAKSPLEELLDAIPRDELKAVVTEILEIERQSRDDEERERVRRATATDLDAHVIASQAESRPVRSRMLGGAYETLTQPLPVDRPA